MASAMPTRVRTQLHRGPARRVAMTSRSPQRPRRLLLPRATLSEASGTDCHQRADLLKRGWPKHVPYLQLINAGERLFLACGNDLGRGHLAHSGERLELIGRGGVEIDQAAADGLDVADR